MLVNSPKPHSFAVMQRARDHTLTLARCFESRGSSPPETLARAFILEI